jgi:RNA 2',3'-cyclic 3'-phosphodiesterase
VRRAALTIEFEGLAWFGGDKPRAIIAKVRSTPALSELQGELERLMRRLGLAPETRNFLPHVTLARLRSSSPLAVADYLSSRGALDVSGFEAPRVVLYSARNSVGGGPYVVEAAYPLD